MINWGFCFVSGFYGCHHNYLLHKILCKKSDFRGNFST
jgi:hypothetical protein